MNSLLKGGRRRRRTRAWLIALAALVLLAAGGGAAYYLLDRGSSHTARAHVSAQQLAARARASALRAKRQRRLAVEREGQILMAGRSRFRVHFARPPKAGLLFDMTTGRVMWRYHPYKIVPIASLTKMMTAWIVVHRTRPDDRVRITKDALNYRGQGVGVLPKGKRVRLETLLNGLLIVSGNDTAIALADHVAGSQRRFVNAMNRWARRLHLRCTHFADVYGLNPGSRSCARDLAVLARLDMRSRRIRRIVRRSKVVFRFPVKSHRIWLYGHNPLMEIHYKGTIGLKTGFTDPAGRCFVGVVRRRGHTLAVVLLHSPNPARHAPALLDRGFRYEA